MMRHEAYASGPGDTRPGGFAKPGDAASSAGLTRTGGAANDSPAPEWAVQALDKVDEIVGKVRANTTDRLVRIARLVVFGLLALIMGTTAGVLAIIGLIRGLDELLPGPVWSVYVLLGGLFTGVGAFLWSKKTAQPARA